MTTRTRPLDAGEIARLDAERYREPGRDLLHTRPVTPGDGERARGDEEHAGASRMTRAQADLRTGRNPLGADHTAGRSPPGRGG